MIRSIKIKIRNYFLTTVCILYCTVSIPLDAKPIWEKQWIEITTPNFVIASQLNEKKTRRLAEGLENFHKVVGIFTNMGQLAESSIPTYITVFDGRVKDLGFKHHIAGAFIPNIRSNNIVIFSSRASADLHIIKHEYVHYLIRNHSSIEYPTWFDEGLAEFLATANVNKGKLSYGGINENRWKWLNHGSWKSYTWLLKINDTTSLWKDDAGMYYSQAWALMHYFQFGREGHNFQKQTMSYLTLRRQGVEPVAAFEQAYELSASTLKRKVQKYLTRIKYYKATFAQAYSAADAEISSLSSDVVATRVGHLCLINGEYENAERYFSAALGINRKNTSAITGMGYVHKFAGQYDLAEELFQQAIALEPENILHQLDYGQYFYNRAVMEKSISHKLEWFEKSKQYFKNSLKINKNDPEALAMYALSHLSTGEHVDIALDKFLIAHKRLPSNPDIKLWLADTYIVMGFVSEAKRLLRTVLAWSHSSASEAAQKMLRSIDPELSEPGENREVVTP